MSTATLSTNGQLVIPSLFREALHLRPGDRVSFTLDGEEIVMKRDARGHAKLIEK